jgi:hypothetical protein
MELLAGVLTEAAEELRLVALNEAQPGPRQVSSSLASPPVRPLRIHDLPDELLMGIFHHLRNCDLIKRLRLSSKRLNETSSNFLLDTSHVSPNPKSLERLGQVSRPSHNFKRRLSSHSLSCRLQPRNRSRPAILYRMVFR